MIKNCESSTEKPGPGNQQSIHPRTKSSTARRSVSRCRQPLLPIPTGILSIYLAYWTGRLNRLANPERQPGLYAADVVTHCPSSIDLVSLQIVANICTPGLKAALLVWQALPSSD